MEHNLAVLHEAIAAAVPDRECIVFRDTRLTWADVTDRTRRLANYLLGRGLAVRQERDSLRGWESGQDHVALYLYNGNEYLEGMLGAYKARLAPVNVNYRYVAEELVYLLRDARASAIVYHDSLAPTLQSIRSELPELEVLLQVSDSGHPLLDGAIEYEAALASAPASRPDVEWSSDDLYVLYTGGTTGMPKGVLWRQADIFQAAFGGPDAPVDQIVERAAAGGGRMVASPPFMHGAAHWIAFNTFTSGGTVIVQSQVQRLDPDDVFRTIEREKASGLLIVGDAFARPLIDQLRSASYDLSTLRLLISGGATLAANLKQDLAALLPQVMIADIVGASETGSQGTNMTAPGQSPSTGSFSRNPNSVVLDESLTRLLEPGSPEVGWLAQKGRVPLGYLGDEEKTARTFPVVDGVRYSVPGDRARLLTDGSIELLGRDAVTINSGGEKIFAEEVELAIKAHPGVFDVVVTGRASERWGQEVVALVKLRGPATADELLEEAAKHIARYKLPKAILFLDEIVRSPSGKADYRWARAQVTSPSGPA